MADSHQEEFTKLMNSTEPVDSVALLSLVYDQLRKIAQQRMNEERRDHTLQATAVVHEAYLRIVGNQCVTWASQAHFFAAAAEAMRRILIDYARKRGTLKRGGSLKAVGDVMDLASDEKIESALIIDDLLSRLEKEDEQAAQVVRLRFFAGLSIEETASALGVSEATVNRDWAFARAWLLKRWEDQNSHDGQ